MRRSSKEASAEHLQKKLAELLSRELTDDVAKEIDSCIVALLRADSIRKKTVTTVTI